MGPVPESSFPPSTICSLDEMASSSSDGFEIAIENLTFSFGQDATPSLSNVNIHLPKGSRTLLVGANGGRFMCAHACMCAAVLMISVCEHSWEVNIASNPRGQAADLDPGHGRPYQGKRCVS